ncbi:MAG: YggT family protein [Clostridiales bacterium]|nr:YggT family protein [Clostridiales bacterium]
MALLMIMRSFVHLMLTVLELMFFGRAVLSWFRELDNETINKLYEALYSLTEPLIIPMRILLDKFAWSRESPIDFAFSFTFMILIILTMFF